jgi:hypothetical protein
MARPLSTNTISQPFTRIRRRTQSVRLRAYAALALGVICIGFSAIFTKWVNLAGPVHVTGAVSAFYRVAIATIALAIPYGLYLARSRRRVESLKYDVQSQQPEAQASNLKLSPPPPTLPSWATSPPSGSASARSSSSTKASSGASGSAW